jgi:hypothetical protein
MKVRCMLYQDCPKTDCPHYPEHKPIQSIDYIGGKGLVWGKTCAQETRTCGLTEPNRECRCAKVSKNFTQEFKEIPVLI